jgi:hypothetical protein
MKGRREDLGESRKKGEREKGEEEVMGGKAASSCTWRGALAPMSVLM